MWGARLSITALNQEVEWNQGTVEWNQGTVEWNQGTVEWNQGTAASFVFFSLVILYYFICIYLYAHAWNGTRVPLHASP